MLNSLINRKMGWTCNIIGLVLIYGFQEPIMSMVFLSVALFIFLTLLLKTFGGN